MTQPIGARLSSSAASFHAEGTTPAPGMAAELPSHVQPLFGFLLCPARLVDAFLYARGAEPVRTTNKRDAIKRGLALFSVRVAAVVQLSPRGLYTRPSHHCVTDRVRFNRMLSAGFMGNLFISGASSERRKNADSLACTGCFLFVMLRQLPCK